MKNEPITINLFQNHGGGPWLCPCPGKPAPHAALTSTGCLPANSCRMLLNVRCPLIGL
jgi:hypothetical protein